MFSVLILGLTGLSAAANARMLQRDIAPPNGAQQCFDPTNQPADESDGSCGKMDPDDGDHPCVQYCEVKVSWAFGPEVSFGATCQAGDPTCAIAENQGTSVTNEHSFNFGFSLGKRDTADPASPLDRIKAGFNFGASWSWSNTKSSAVTTANTKPANAMNECGYWTFVPYYVTSYGSLTYGDYEPAIDGEGGGYPGAPPVLSQPASCSNVKTVGNFCQSMPYVNSDGKTLGETVFVAMDCDTNKQLPFCYQQKPYLQIGVSDNPDVFINYLYAHTPEQVAARDISSPAESTTVIYCSEDKWTMNFDQDPNWKDGGIGHAVAPMPSGALAAGV